MLTKHKWILLAPLAAAIAAHAAPVLMDMGRSHVDIAVSATIDSFVAHLQVFDLTVHAATLTGRIESATFRSRFESVKTGNADRDRDMNDWQQTGRFPDVLFTLTTLETAGGGKSVAHGQLTFHGVERSVSFPLALETKDRVLALDGDVTIDTRDYGLPVIRKYFVLRVDPIVHLHFHLEGKLDGS